MSRFVLSSVILVLALATSAAASTFLAVEPEALVPRAEAVVEGRVTAVESFWNAAGTAIFTRATLKVEEVVLGRASRVVTVVTPGGRVGDYHLEAHGFPRFEIGNHELLFLTRVGDELRVLEHQQGQFHVHIGERGERLAVSALDHGAHLVGRSAAKVARPEPVDLDDFKAQLRAVAAQHGEVER